ncbi:conserved hypothetical protein [Thermosulfidibacter takaii ABI70S6]|uniref:UPF0434 protein TST_1646 n=1 Tax=Thermosulfidibacter takaii (strain DSM 17441 / JCM 13301 / NBRC 103674 / ABI70S6) TaxID=1298851 RepID=A0A0S3QVR9_THET7|nr:Trm112 family protein [Thermosulfidibacter takaii]BAT72430.1 conserved hypothetical protein [Thermosulfidibacter takaii ABI70S6]
MAVAEELKKILVCPQCKGDLEYVEDPEVFICHSCKLVYPVKDDIPVMLVEEAIPLEEWQKDKS